MEKTISPEERIRRAEEIYYRRKVKNNNVRMSSSQVKEENQKRQFSLYKKMILQILICILIYLIFSLIKEANYLFSEDIINKTKELLNTDMNFQAILAIGGMKIRKTDIKIQKSKIKVMGKIKIWNKGRIMNKSKIMNKM